MLWFLVLHIAALLFWGACLLYLPALIAGASRDSSAIKEPPDPFDSIARFVLLALPHPQPCWRFLQVVWCLWWITPSPSG